MKVKYCPTEMMIADFYTKRLQGKLFRFFRNMTLNLNDENMQNIICAEKLTLMENYKSNDHDINDRGSVEAAEGYSRSNFGSGKGAVATGILQAWRERVRVGAGEYGQRRVGVRQGTLVCWDGDR